MAALPHELRLFQHIRKQLKEKFPEVDEDTLLDTLEGMTNLQELLGGLVRSSLEDRCFGQALRSRIKDMQVRLAAFEERAEKKRQLVAAAMEQASIPRFREADFTVSLRQLPLQVTVIEDSLIPKPYWVEQAPKLDRRGLAEALRSGENIPGAMLDNGGTTISVRTK